MRYFDHLFTVETIKSEFRDLAFRHHPDRGGDTATMQEINAQYHAALQRCNGQTSQGDNGKEHRYYYNEAVESAVLDKILSLISMNLSGVRISLIGTWIWVTGDTKPHKELFKSQGLRWHATRLCWYYTTSKHYGKPSRYGLDTLAMRYGYADGSEFKRKRHVAIEH